jgi:hypothetical protein
MNFKPKELLHLIERVFQTLSILNRDSSLIQELVNDGGETSAPGSKLAVWAGSFATPICDARVWENSIQSLSNSPSSEWLPPRRKKTPKQLGRSAYQTCFDEMAVQSLG